MDYYESVVGLAPSTKRLYHDYLHKWLRCLPSDLDEKEKLTVLVRAPHRAAECLVRHLHATHPSALTLANMRHYLLAVLALLRYTKVPYLEDRMGYYQHWLTIVNQNSKPMMDRRLRQLPTEKQLERGGVRLTYEDLMAARDRLERDEETRGSEGHVLLSMYTYLYPVRADYYAMVILESNAAIPPSPQNYWRWKEGHKDAEVVLREFKTARVFGEIRHEHVPAELVAVIEESLRKRPRKYMFETVRGHPHTRNSFSRWASEKLEEIMGVQLNITIIRHLFVSTLSMETAPIELTRIGQLMGHSITNQRLYKWVLPEEEEE